MPFWNFIQNLFGLDNSKEPTIKGFFGYQNNDSFNDSFWQHNEDECNVSPFCRRNSQFNVFNDPFEMSRYFESQIDHMLKDFMVGFANEGFHTFTNSTPFISPHQENLRDKMLKPNCDILSPAVPKKDSDLDGKITPDNFSKVWDKQEPILVQEPKPFITGKCITKEYVRGPDGTVKQKQTIRDHEGNEETTISQRTGDKIYTVVVKKDKNGVETKTENFINTDGELTDGNSFLKNEPSFNNIDLNFFSWEKFFNPNPKL
nr:PREDICTED: HCLS1-associated protein X-1-like isoform X2 [Megachile rotundata]